MSTIASNAMTPQKAMLELTLLNAEQANREFDEVLVEGIKRGLPPEVLTRLQSLWDETRVIGGEVIAIGKVVVTEIVKFLQANPGMAVGAAIGAAVGALVGLIPWIGPMLAPIAIVLGALYGAGVGAATKKVEMSGSPVSAAIALAEKFFELFAMIINAVEQYVSS